MHTLQLMSGASLLVKFVKFTYILKPSALTSLQIWSETPLPSCWMVQFCFFPGVCRILPEARRPGHRLHRGNWATASQVAHTQEQGPERWGRWQGEREGERGAQGGTWRPHAVWHAWGQVWTGPRIWKKVTPTGWGRGEQSSAVWHAVCAPHLLCPAVEIDGPKIHVLGITSSVFSAQACEIGAQGVGSRAKRFVGKIAHVEFFIPCTHMVHTFCCVLMKVLEMDLIEIFFITLVVCVECFFLPR